MLNESDIDFMAEAHDEIYTLRQRPISFIYVEKQYDPITETPIGEQEIAKQVKAVVTEKTLSKGEGGREEVGGIIYEQGDIKIDVKIEYIAGIADKVTRVEFDGKKYELLGVDKKGIGLRNRYELLGREIA